jgi:tetratricopeptide (TPR) repeat protein
MAAVLLAVLSTPVAGSPWHDAMDAAERAIRDGRVEDAERSLRSAIAEVDRPGAPRIRLARSVEALADLYHSRERLEQAEPLYLRAIVLWEETLGPRQPRTGIALHNLALLYLAQCRVEEAMPLVERVVNLWGETLGADHPDRVTAIRSEAEMLRRCGRTEEAAALQRRIDPAGGGVAAR